MASPQALPVGLLADELGGALAHSLAGPQQQPDSRERFVERWVEPTTAPPPPRNRCRSHSSPANLTAIQEAPSEPPDDPRANSDSEATGPRRHSDPAAHRTSPHMLARRHTLGLAMPPQSLGGGLAVARRWSLPNLPAEVEDHTRFRRELDNCRRKASLSAITDTE